jgi:hypothetical protein
MSKKDTDTDRRTLIVAATAVAGVAAAGSAAAFNPQPEPPGKAPPPTQIRVDLGGVHLSPAQAQALEQQISKDVLAALARAGVRGQPHVGGLGPGIYGLIYRPVFLPGTAGMPGAVRDPTRQ